MKIRVRIPVAVNEKGGWAVCAMIEGQPYRPGQSEESEVEAAELPLPVLRPEDVQVD